ncbi:hypothetical protein HDU67_010005 [Dinochytrium kinnereticum]|nr:hypothetical protein HDU67_010005 [Dinochytrium kinnereticum]
MFPLMGGLSASVRAILALWKVISFLTFSSTGIMLMSTDPKDPAVNLTFEHDAQAATEKSETKEYTKFCSGYVIAPL